MHIDRLEVRGFGKLAGRTINLSKGMNIIYGGNEAGKTTLQWFIKGMLYGLKGASQTRAGRLQPRKRFMPWNGGQYGGVLVYTLDDGSICRIERDFEKDTARLFDGHYNDISELFGKGRDKQPAFAERQLGLEEAVFERTVLVRQLDVRLDEDGAAVLAGRLANTGSTGFDDISFARAEKALAEALKSRVGTGRTTTQPLDRLESRLSQLNEEHGRLLGKAEQRNRMQRELREARAIRSGLEAESRYLEKIGQLVEVRKSLDKYLKQETGLKEAARRLKELEGALEAALVPDGKESSVAGAASGRSGASGENPATGKSGAAAGAAPFICLAAAALFAGFAGYLALVPVTETSLIIALLCGAGALSSAVAALLSFRKARRAAADPGGRPAKPSSGYENQTGNAQEFAEIEARIKSVCSNASLLCGRLLNDPAAVRQEWKEIESKLDLLSSRLETGIKEIAGMGAGPEAGQESAAADCLQPEALETTLYDMQVDYLEEVWKKETERVNKKCYEAALKEKYCEGVLTDGSGEEDDLQRVEEETVAVMEKIAYLKHRGDALKLAREVLVEAGLEIRRTVAPGLNGRLGSVISGLTAGRYTDLKGDDRLALQAAVPESGDIKSALLLSGAAADQMYLALRLAMADILTAGGESLPLLLDEVFSQFDDNRTALALAYLNTAYKNGQVLIFTCKRREVELARKICGENMNLVEL